MGESFSRKDFFRIAANKIGRAASEALAGYQDAAKALKPKIPVTGFIRPPGAPAEPEFLSACTKCDECIRACPHWVIQKAGPGVSTSMDGTPILIPEQIPCPMCTYFPCIAACEPGALVSPPKGTLIRIGIAVLRAGDCVISRGEVCTKCETACPTAPKAIRFPEGDRPAGGTLPEVFPDLCTGCGFCAAACPVEAISIRPLPEIGTP